MFNFKKTIALLITLSFLITGTALAQGPDVKTKLQETKESIDELVKAKDENSPFDISLRVKTFKKVVNLALTETKDLKINLIALEIESERIKSWREETIEQLNNVINHYEEKLAYIDEKESFTFEEIRKEAEGFKAWREKNYLLLQEEIHDFLLIKKEIKALQISNRRVEKIKNDLEVLREANLQGLDKISTLFEDAKDSIKSAQKENKEALNLFIETYAPPVSTSTLSTATTTATSTLPATSTSPKISTSTEATSTAQTFSSTTTSTAKSKDSPEEQQDKSIRGLVSSSWKRIKSAYQIFIEMSGFVRKSLQ